MIEIITRTVYKTSSGRHYLTKGGAIANEAKWLIKQKYPSENHAYENGRCIGGGFHWTEMRRSDVLFRRVCRLVKNGMYLDNRG